MESGETPTVLALTNGRGDIKDAIVAVLLDSEGNIRNQTKFDNLAEPANKAAFVDLVEKRQPKVVVVGGMSVQTSRLRDEAALALRDIAISKLGENPPVSEAYGDHQMFLEAMAAFDLRLAPHLLPLIFVSDATARLYMQSEEAQRENPSLPLNGRYALGLARYTQNPLNAYCKLGRQIASVTFMEHHQKMVSTS